MTLRGAVGLAGLVLASIVVLAGCQGDAAPTIGPSPTAAAEPAPTPEAAKGIVFDQGPPGTYILFNEKWLEGLSTEGLDLEDVDAVFWHIFSRLPDEVTVYPSENYYYFIMYVDRRQLWGNIRLPAGKRDRGVLSFAYFEFKESPFVTEPRAGRSKIFTKADALFIEKVDPFTYNVEYNDRVVTFHLNQLSQEPPKLFPLGEDEVSIERTFDESGYQFFLIFNEKRNFFLWVLNEEEMVPDQFEVIEEDLVVGRRSGFAFWVDKDHGDRKILVAIRGQNATRNDYYDGPFDQLADNYVDENRISEYMIKASPSLRRRIDKYGYFTDRESSRVSISPYYVYFSQQALKIFVDRTRAAPDPYYFISRKGLPPTPTPGPRRTGSSTQPKP